MPRTGVLVLCYAAPAVIGRVVRLLGSEHFRYFLHVDAKLELAAYQGRMMHASGVTFVEPRIGVFWGGYNTIEAELALARAALADPALENFILISDDSAPLLPAERISEALGASPDRISCEARRPDHVFYRNFYYVDSKFTSLRHVVMAERAFTDADSLAIQRLERLRAQGKKPLPALYVGRQWWSFGRDSLSRIVSLIDGDAHLAESFRVSFIPDEMFFQTAYRMCCADRAHRDMPVYADFRRQAKLPWVFSSAAEIAAAGIGEDFLFVRKIKADCPGIVDDLAGGWG